MIVFIIPFYNCALYINECLQTLIHQNDRYWRAIVCDDCSTDGSATKVPVDDRIRIITNANRLTALPNIHNAIINSNLKDDDIICILDGDDKLTTPHACTIIKNIYDHFQPLLTYGQYVTSQGLIGHCRPYTEDTFLNLRSNMYWASHLRTFKYKLYKQIVLQDPHLTCYKNKNGEIYQMAYDVAIMTPLLEIAGLRNIYFNPIPLYLYRIHQYNDHIVNLSLQTATANEIYSKPKFKQVF